MTPASATAQPKAVAALIGELTACQLPLVGIAAREQTTGHGALEARLTAILPGFRSVVMAGNAGDAFAREALARGRPGDPDPIDTHARAVMARATAGFAQPHAVVFPFSETGREIDFRTLALLAGLGVPSRMGILIHPRYGLWTALRAAVLLPVSAPATGPLTGYDPCAPCPGPCAAACPGGAFPAATWDWQICFAYRGGGGCESRCASRHACPEGASHRYAAPVDEHHHRSALRLFSG